MLHFVALESAALELGCYLKSYRLSVCLSKKEIKHLISYVCSLQKLNYEYPVPAIAVTSSVSKLTISY